MERQTLQATFAAWRQRNTRRAYLPVLADPLACNSADEGRSAFGGAPLMRPDEDWPQCEGCGQPMLFLLQLDLATLPDRGDLGLPSIAGRTGLLQLFYCPTEDGPCETSMAFSGASLPRVIDGGPFVARVPPEAVRVLPARPILRWHALWDHPHPDEHEALGLSADYDYDANHVHFRCPALGLDVGGLDMHDHDPSHIACAEDGDKLYGWPCWTQGIDPPSCPTCDSPMDLVLQIASDQAVPVVFGDEGIGFLTECPRHPGVVAFSWAGR